MKLTIPKTCNWVEARAKCSIDQIFIALREVVDSDVKTMQSIASTTRAAVDDVSMSLATDTKFIVTGRRDPGGVFDGNSVVFERAIGRIVVKDGRSQGTMFDVQPALCIDGECRLELVGGNGDALELWQVSRKALENLFFNR